MPSNPYFARRLSLPVAALAACCLTAPLAYSRPQPAAARVVPEPPRGVVGSVVAIAEDKVALRQKDGTVIEVPMTKGWTVSTPRRASVAEVQIGDFVGSASRDIGPGRGQANELRVFEPGYRPEYGTHAIAAPGTSMTHGFVFGLRSGNGAQELEVAYPGGKRVILVPSDAQVTVFDLLPRSAAAPGIEVSAVTRPGSDGVRRASRLTIAPAH